MNKDAEIVVIEDDIDDLEIILAIFEDLKVKNKIRPFTNSKEALEYLSQPDVRPFMVFSDINMPQLDGLELKAKMAADENARMKCIPYVFLTTSSDPRTVAKAYDCAAQGFFTKATDYDVFKENIRLVLNYWTVSLIP